MTGPHAILLVESDAECGRTLARLLRRNGHRVRLVRTARAASAWAAREAFDLAVVDVLVPGGGVDLGRELARRVPRLYLSVGAPLLPEEILEAALGFPVVRKATLPDAVGSYGNGNGNGAGPH
ncbi:MAG: hypothetical protein LJF30_13615 [Acidobacteria bacterium]|jgi:CheY-like chemotaxis protein|nr:hypothetical protein [Acidobacteriota bacterium]